MTMLSKKKMLGPGTTAVIVTKKEKNMLTPTIKSPHVDNYLMNHFGVDREQAILDEVCVPAPIGCGAPVSSFRTKEAADEYMISGLCQKCQDVLFAEEE